MTYITIIEPTICDILHILIMCNFNIHIFTFDILVSKIKTRGHRTVGCSPENDSL